MSNKIILIKGTPKNMDRYYFYCPDCGAFWYEKSYKNVQYSYCPTAGCIRLVPLMDKDEAEKLINQINPEYPITNEWLPYVCDSVVSNFPNLPNEWRN